MNEVFLKLLAALLRGIFIGLIVGYAAALLLAYSAHAEVNQVVATIVRESDKHNLDPKLVAAVIKVESGWRTDAMSRTGDHGLMQLNPRFFADVREMTVNENIKAGIKHLAFMRDTCPLKSGHTFVICFNQGSQRHPKYPLLHPYYKKVMREYLSLKNERD